MSIELGSREFWERLRNDPALLAYEVCRIDLTQMEEMLVKQPALKAWVNATFEVARIEEERLKWELTKRRAEALVVAKSTPDPHTGKPKTVAVLDAEVEIDSQVQEITGRLIQAQTKRASLRAMVDALEDRKDMLIQLAARQRQELQSYN